MTEDTLFRSKYIKEDFTGNTIALGSLSNMKMNEENRNQGYNWKDFGVFSRNEQHLEEITNLLKKSDIPFVLHKQDSFTVKKPFHQINSLFRFMLSEKDITAFVDILLHVLTGFSTSDVRGIFLAGNRKDESLHGLVLRLYNQNVLSDSQYTGLIRLFKLCKKYKIEVMENGIAAGITGFCREFPSLERAFAGFPVERDYYLNKAYSCHTNMVKFLKGYIYTYGADESENGIQLSPFHLAKGLEIPVLFIPGMEEGTCPFYGESPDMEMEEGLFYSAITRVKEMVCISYSESRSGEKMMMSSFIKEMGPHIREITPNVLPVREYEQETLFPL